MSTITPTPPEPPEETPTQRHLRMCQRLAELGMQLAEAAAQKATKDWQPTQTTPEIQAAEAADPAEAPKPASPDPALTFARLARCVRQCIALEASLRAGQTPTPRRALSDPRRAPIQRIFDEATRKTPERHEIRREAENLLDQELLADPEQNTPLPDLFHSIVAELGLHIDPATISNRSLNDLCPGEPPLDVNEKAATRPDRTPEELLAIIRGDNDPYAHEPPPPQITPPPPPPTPLPPPWALPPKPPPKLHPFLAAHQFHPGSVFDRLKSSLAR